MEQLKHLLQNIIKYFFPILIFTVIIMITFFSNLSVFIKAQNFIFPTPICMLIALILIIIITIIYKTCRFTNIDSILRNTKIILIATLILFIFQIFVCWSAFFMTTWDPGVLTNNAYNIAHGQTDFLYHAYFSRYPNNLFLTFIFVQVYKFADFIGFSSIENGTFIIVIIQCAISSLSGLLTFYITKNISGSIRTAWVSYFIYIALIGTSPWVMIPYSDSITLIFPVFTMWLYTTLRNGRLQYLKWIIIVLTAFLGYKLKPQAVIVFIAVVIIHILYHKITKSGMFFCVKLFIPLMALIVLLNSGISKAGNSLPLQLDAEQKFGMSHFLMLGLNYEHGGIYNTEDMAFSLQYSTAKERKEANLQEAVKRLKAFTPMQMIEHITRKNVSNYSNGVFGWGQEGGAYFFKDVSEDRVPVISPFLKNSLYLQGKFYKYFAITKQIMWFFVLILCVFSLSKKGHSHTNLLLVIALSIIGLTIFETIFEARARYLYIYVPFYIILASVGLRALINSKFLRRLKK